MELMSNSNSILFLVSFKFHYVQMELKESFKELFNNNKFKFHYVQMEHSFIQLKISPI